MSVFAPTGKPVTSGKAVHLLLVIILTVYIVQLPIAVSAELDPNVKADLDDLAVQGKDFQSEFASKVDPVVEDFWKPFLFETYEKLDSRWSHVPTMPYLIHLTRNARDMDRPNNCEDTEWFLDDALYRVTHTNMLLHRILDKADWQDCSENIRCQFINDLIRMAESLSEKVQKAQETAGLVSNSIPESYLPLQDHPKKEPYLREMYYRVMSEFRNQMTYIVEGTEFISQSCF